jgi:hypothetical protein
MISNESAYGVHLCPSASIRLRQRSSEVDVHGFWKTIHRCASLHLLHKLEDELYESSSKVIGDRVKREGTDPKR